MDSKELREFFQTCYCEVDLHFIVHLYGGYADQGYITEKLKIYQRDGLLTFYCQLDEQRQDQFCRMIEKSQADSKARAEIYRNSQLKMEKGES